MTLKAIILFKEKACKKAKFLLLNNVVVCTLHGLVPKGNSMDALQRKNARTKKSVSLRNFFASLYSVQLLPPLFVSVDRANLRQVRIARSVANIYKEQTTTKLRE